MTRKKQDAPQRLGGQPDSPDTKLGPICDDDSIAAEEVQTAPHTPPVPTSEDQSEKATVQRPFHNGSGTMDPSSCDKLLAFTMDFLSKKANSLHDGGAAGNHDNNANPRRSLSSSSSSNSSGQVKVEKRSRSPDAFPKSGRDVSSSPPKSKIPTSTQPNFDAMLSGIDVASLTAANCVAMLQQQFYGQCPNDWIHVQRNDNNCLSKSKAERYRWCVQGSPAGHGLNGAAGPKRHGSTGAGGSPGTVAPGSSNGTTGLKKAQTANGTLNGGQQQQTTNDYYLTQDKLFGSVFAGASKFHCRDCGVSFNTLVELTVHMNKTGHFRDSNAPGSDRSKSDKDEHFALPNSSKMKRPGGREEENGAEKVLTCMGCGNLFESLQDLSVHMIKTKHYEKVPSWRIHLGLVNGSSPSANETGARKRPTNQVPVVGQQTTRKPEVTSPLVDFSSVLTQSPFYYPLLGAMANPAAYAASLLYSAPWLSSSLFPSLLGAGATSSSGYPAPFPPGFVPSSFCLPPASNQHPGFKCSECPESFRSLQELSGHHRRHLNVSSSSASPTSSNESSTSSSQKRAESSLIRPEPGANKAKEENPASGFDFIKSLESTIQSAISKVEAPRSGTTANAKPFTPFSSSINSPTTAAQVSRKESKELLKGHHRQAESPLDLTVKRDPRHPEISAYSGSLPQRDPLECLKENMNSLFSAFRKKQYSPPSTTIYQPLIKDKLSTNPLQEMLKIVESAAPETRKNHNHYHHIHPGRKRSLIEASQEERAEPKKLRSSSILHDLIIPRDLPKSSSSSNPIQRMQDLVDSRITSKPITSLQPAKSIPSAAFVTSPIFSASPVTSSNASCSPVTSLAAFVSSSRFALPASGDADVADASRKDGAKQVTSSNECNDVANDESWKDAISKRQELLLQRHHAVFVTSHNLKSPSIGDVEVDAMARLVKLPSNVVKDWVRSTSHQRSSVTPKSPFKCAQCSSDKFPGVEEFIKHLDQHLDDSPPPDDAIGVTSSPPQATSKSSLRFQGSLCFSSYRNHVIPSPKRIDDVTPSPAASINPFRHQRDEDDVISVTG